MVEANFEQWRAIVRDCLTDAADRLAPETDLDQLATFILTTMEGGVMLSRSYRDIAPFDAAVRSLEDYIQRLTVNRDPNAARERVSEKGPRKT